MVFEVRMEIWRLEGKVGGKEGKGEGRKNFV